MIKIRLNGEVKKVKTNSTATELLQQLNIEVKRLAIEINEEILPRSQFGKYLIKENDKVEIVHAIGGG